jgi:hypothetical protein
MPPPRETLSFAHGGWAGVPRGVGSSSSSGVSPRYDEEDGTGSESASARSARLASADIPVAPPPGATANGLFRAAAVAPGVAASALFRPAAAARRRAARAERVIGELEAIGSAVAGAVTPARRGAPHAPLFTCVNAAVCTLLLFWCVRKKARERQLPRTKINFVTQI